MLGTGSAASILISAVEFLRRRVKGVHIAYEILTTCFKDEYEPLYEGLDNVHIERKVATIKAHISLKKGDELKNKVGYLPPLDEKAMLDEE